MSIPKGEIVKGYAKMWPRVVFDLKTPDEAQAPLQVPGVYVLYRDEMPYYVGKTAKRLWRRIRSHAIRPRGRYYNFWNYFSAFVVPVEHLDEIEGVLIASMPTKNAVIKRIDRIHIPPAIAGKIRKGHVKGMDD
jgi:hypothetical protein